MKVSGIEVTGPMVDADQALSDEHLAWVRGDFPSAKNIGDVVLELAKLRPPESKGQNG